MPARIDGDIAAEKLSSGQGVARRRRGIVLAAWALLLLGVLALMRSSQSISAAQVGVQVRHAAEAAGNLESNPASIDEGGSTAGNSSGTGDGDSTADGSAAESTDESQESGSNNDTNFSDETSSVGSGTSTSNDGGTSSSDNGSSTSSDNGSSSSSSSSSSSGGDAGNSSSRGNDGATTSSGGSDVTTTSDGAGSQNSTGYPNAATRELLPRVMRRPAQVALEKRWGLRQVLEPRPQPESMRIPRILHHVSLPKIDWFLNQAADAKGTQREQWPLSCRRMHPDWQYVFWDLDSVTELIKNYYPDFANMYIKLDSIIKKADATRYFLMHAFGGLYLDLDVECFAPVDSWLEGYDMVLQNPGPTNGILASVPGHPLFEAAIKEMRKRWWADPRRAVVELTGPGLLSSVVRHIRDAQETKEQASTISGLHRLFNTSVMFHTLGEYFTPCDWDKPACHTRIVMERALGTVNLTQFVGYHRFAASWWGTGAEGKAGVFNEQGLKKQVCGS